MSTKTRRHGALTLALSGALLLGACRNDAKPEAQNVQLTTSTPSAAARAATATPAAQANRIAPETRIRPDAGARPGTPNGRGQGSGSGSGGLFGSLGTNLMSNPMFAGLGSMLGNGGSSTLSNQRGPNQAPAAQNQGPEQYRFAFTMNLDTDCKDPAKCRDMQRMGAFTLSFEGAVESPRRAHIRIKGNMPDEALDMEAILYDDMAWSRDNTKGGGWKQEDAGAADMRELPLMFGAFGGKAVDNLDGFAKIGPETVNGVRAVHYRLVENPFAKAFDPNDPDLKNGGDELQKLFESFKIDADMWLTESEQWPVRIVYSMGMAMPEGSFTTKMVVNLSDINSGNVKVQKP